MNAADTRFRSRSGAARDKPITARRSVSLGDLTELAGSPVSLPAGATPAGIIAN